MKKKEDVSCKVVEKRYNEEWLAREDYQAGERVLTKAFLQLVNSGADEEDLLDRALTAIRLLDSIYNTNLRMQNKKFHPVDAAYAVARHICARWDHIISGIRAGDYSVVDEIADINSANGGKVRAFSFATKFCSFLSRALGRDLYSIYDSHVAKQLKLSLGAKRFDASYADFDTAIQEYRKMYNLDTKSITPMKLDKFLWLTDCFQSEISDR